MQKCGDNFTFTLLTSEAQFRLSVWSACDALRPWRQNGVATIIGAPDNQTEPQYNQTKPQYNQTEPAYNQTEPPYNQTEPAL